MIYFTADTHFWHTNILRYCPRRKEVFGDIETMNDAFIDTINASVKPNDTLYHLGDFCWSAAKTGSIRQRIKCRKIHVVRGNHDSSSLRSHVSSMDHMVFLKNPKMHLCHYPLASWGGQFYGGYHLHGHCHGRLKLQELENHSVARSMDVGVDAIFNRIGEWRPISIDEVIEILE